MVSEFFQNKINCVKISLAADFKICVTLRIELISNKSSTYVWCETKNEYMELGEESVMLWACLLSKHYRNLAKVHNKTKYWNSLIKI